MFKHANEGNARIACAEGGVPSIAIRPYIVYGPGRDQGLTSGPTLAMAAAARGEEFTIGYGGIAQYDYARDVGYAFARAAACVGEGAIVANFPGVVASVEQIVETIESVVPAARGLIDWDDVALPFPAELEATALEATLGPLPRMSLAEGVAATIDSFR